MVLVDTSVWSHALRPSGSPEIQAIVKPLILNGEAALTDWILLEIMTGIRKQDNQRSSWSIFRAYLAYLSIPCGGPRPGV